MKINYDALDSKNLIVRPFVSGAHHWFIGTTSLLKLGICQRIAHVALAILSWIPILNYLLYAVERAVCGISQKKPIEVVKINGLSAYQTGKVHGHRFKSTIRRLYKEYALPLIARFEKKHSRDCTEIGKRLVDRMDPSIKQELRGLAEGAGVSYEEVVRVNTFLSVFPEESACSAVAIQDDQFIATANGGVDKHPAGVIREAAYKTRDAVKSMLASNRDRTIQTVIFEPHLGRISVSRRGEYAAGGIFHRIPWKSLFGKGIQQGPGKVVVGRNLDWSGGAVAYDTIVLVRNGIATVTMPGLITGMTAINSHGVSASYLTDDFALPPNGQAANTVDTPLQMYQVLKGVTTVDEFADTLFEKTSPLHGNHHMMIADRQNAKAVSYTAATQSATFTPLFVEDVG